MRACNIAIIALLLLTGTAALAFGLQLSLDRATTLHGMAGLACFALSTSGAAVLAYLTGRGF